MHKNDDAWRTYFTWKTFLKPLDKKDSARNYDKTFSSFIPAPETYLVRVNETLRSRTLSGILEGTLKKQHRETIKNKKYQNKKFLNQLQEFIPECKEEENNESIETKNNEGHSKQSYYAIEEYDSDVIWVDEVHDGEKNKEISVFKTEVENMVKKENGEKINKVEPDEENYSGNNISGYKNFGNNVSFFKEEKATREDEKTLFDVKVEDNNTLPTTVDNKRLCSNKLSNIQNCQSTGEDKRSSSGRALDTFVTPRNEDKVAQVKNTDMDMSDKKQETSRLIAPVRIEQINIPFRNIKNQTPTKISAPSNNSNTKPEKCSPNTGVGVETDQSTFEFDKLGRGGRSGNIELLAKRKATTHSCVVVPVKKQKLVNISPEKEILKSRESMNTKESKINTQSTGEVNNKDSVNNKEFVISNVQTHKQVHLETSSVNYEKNIGSNPGLATSKLNDTIPSDITKYNETSDNSGNHSQIKFESRTILDEILNYKPALDKCLVHGKRIQEISEVNKVGTSSQKILSSAHNTQNLRVPQTAMDEILNYEPASNDTRLNMTENITSQSFIRKPLMSRNEKNEEGTNSECTAVSTMDEILDFDLTCINKQVVTNDRHWFKVPGIIRAEEFHEKTTFRHENKKLIDDTHANGGTKKAFNEKGCLFDEISTISSSVKQKTDEIHYLKQAINEDVNMNQLPETNQQATKESSGSNEIRVTSQTLTINKEKCLLDFNEENLIIPETITEEIFLPGTMLDFDKMTMSQRIVDSIEKNCQASNENQSTKHIRSDEADKALVDDKNYLKRDEMSAQKQSQESDEYQQDDFIVSKKIKSVTEIYNKKKRLDRMKSDRQTSASQWKPKNLDVY